MPFSRLILINVLFLLLPAKVFFYSASPILSLETSQLPAYRHTPPNCVLVNFWNMLTFSANDFVTSWLLGYQILLVLCFTFVSLLLVHVIRCGSTIVRTDFSRSAIASTYLLYIDQYSLNVWGHYRLWTRASRHIRPLSHTLALVRRFWFIKRSAYVFTEICMGLI